VLHAWAKSVNASGGIEGHPVDLMFFDDASSPGTSVTDAQTLISDHVAVIVDNSLFDTTWANAVNAAKIPVVSGDQAPVFDTNPDFFSVTQTFGSLFYAETSIAKKAGASNMGTLVCAEAATCLAELPGIKAAGQQLGIPLVYNTEVSATAPNYTAQCVAAQQAKATALLIEVAAQTATSVSTNCNQQGYNPTYVGDSSSYLPSMDAAAIGKNYWIDYPTLPDFADTPAVQAMNAAVDKYYPGLRQGKSSVQWTGNSSTPWVAGLLIRDAVKGSGVTASGTVTATTLTQGLYSLKNDTLDGWSSPLTFVAGKPNPVSCWFLAKIANGATSVLNNGQPTCEPAPAS
jgi:branched-chain amino acid transport system substrate-binding protein